MRILNLKDNPLFIRCWYERMRFSVVVSAITIMVLVVGLIFLSCYINQETLTVYDYYSKTHTPVPWLNFVFFYISIAQGVLIFFFGTRSISVITSNEKMSGTLDLHRCSPITRINQIIGLLLGAPILEWIVFFMAMLINFVITLLSSIKIYDFIVLYLGMILSVLLWHSLIMFFSLSSSKQRNRLGVLSGFILIFFFLPWILTMRLSSITHLTVFPSYIQLYQSIIGFAQKVPPWRSVNDWNILHGFYGFKIATLPFQFMVQVPLLTLLIFGISRKISFDDRPVFSKIQSSILFFLMIFYLTGSIITNTIYDSAMYNYYAYNYAILYVICFFVIALVLSFSATPTHLIYSKGLRRVKKTGLSKFSLSDEANSNLLWTVTILYIASLFYALFCYYLAMPARYAVLVFFLLSTQLILYTSAFEWFRLSAFRRKMAYFWTLIIILWLIVPILGFVTKPMVTAEFYEYYLSGLSPFFWSGQLLPKLWGPVSLTLLSVLITLVLINGVLAMAAVLLAYKTRQSIQNSLSMEKFVYPVS
ncbi:MAG: hypothetical protein PHV17_08550 [Candidatus Omnitrophica bacterium]|nr:hypothetical protein [Candidatus Omnitrophota bacterium]